MSNEIIKVGMIAGTNLECNRRVYSAEGICPTLNTCGGGGREPMILVKKRKSKDDRTSNEQVNYND